VNRKGGYDIYKIKLYYDLFNGDDDTGDGTKANPFRTLFKSVQSISQQSDFEVQFIPLHIIREEDDGGDNDE